MDSQKKDPLYKSFGYAFEGIGTCIKKERNMKIHCAAAILVVIAGVILKISSLEWCICLTLAKIAKDTAAGAVLIAAIMAAIAGIIIFLPKGLTFLGF